MASNTIYEYATKAWPVALGCSPHMSCAPRCWAKRTVNRLASSPNPKVRAAHEGLVEINAGCSGEPGLYWTGLTRLNEPHINDPYGWRKPQRIATGYHGDWMRLSEVDRHRIMTVMQDTPQHRYLTLTKCAAEQLRYMQTWPPPPNLLLGVSVTTQADADERIPLLLQTPAAVRWVSMEPLLGPVDLFQCGAIVMDMEGDPDTPGCSRQFPRENGIDWVVLGGESGPGARPCDLAWIRVIMEQCRTAQVPVFVKQVGARPLYDGHPFGVTDRKGASPEEWPIALRVRELPA